MEKRFFFPCILFLFAAILMFPATALAKESINKTSASVYVKNTIRLQVNGTKKKVSWISSNKKIATVTSSGTVTGIKAGQTKITAKIGTKKLYCKITVLANKKRADYDSYLYAKMNRGDWIRYTDDIYSTSLYPFKPIKKGQYFSLCTLSSQYTDVYLADLNQDGCKDYVAKAADYTLILTTLKNKPKIVSAIYTGTGTVQTDYRYSKSTKTFSIIKLINARLRKISVFRLNNGSVSRIVTFSDYVNPMDSNFMTKVDYFVNDKESTAKKFKSYYNKYIKNTSKFTTY